MNIQFRPATADDALFIAHGFHAAMLMEDTEEERVALFADRICRRDDVLYCARNTIIATVDGMLVGMLTAYDGQYYAPMRQRTMALVKDYLGIEFPGMEDEAASGEYYLDSLAVVPGWRKHGVGRALLKQGIAKGKELGLEVTLAVDPVNERAQKLYESLGFEYAGDLYIFGHTYWKMKV